MPPPDEYTGPERRAAAPSEVRLTEESFRPGRVSLLRAFHRILKEQPYEKGQPSERDRPSEKDQAPRWR